MDIRLFSFDELDIVQISCLPPNELFLDFSKKSKYLQGSVFSLFQHSFELASSDYDYYSLNSFTASQAVALRNHLMTNQSRLAAIKSAEDIEKIALKQLSGIDFMNSLKEQVQEWRVSWEKIRSNLLKVGEELIEMTDGCIDEDLILWIKGF